jgi:hypothetical protein
MRSILNALLVVLLIAAFAIGAPIPVQASCQDSSDCNLAKAGLTDGSCDQKGEPCKIAQNCASPLHKMPVYSAIRVLPDAAQTPYEPLPSDATASAFVLPETAPPRA